MNFVEALAYMHDHDGIVMDSAKWVYRWNKNQNQLDFKCKESKEWVECRNPVKNFMNIKFTKVPPATPAPPPVDEMNYIQALQAIEDGKTVVSQYGTKYKRNGEAIVFEDRGTPDKTWKITSASIVQFKQRTYTVYVEPTDWEQAHRHMLAGGKARRACWANSQAFGYNHSDTLIWYIGSNPSNHVSLRKRHVEATDWILL